MLRYKDENAPRRKTNPQKLSINFVKHKRAVYFLPHAVNTLYDQ